MKIIQSPLFGKQKKRLYNNQVKILDKEIKKIASNPGIGQEKRGTLKGVRVDKSNIEKQLFSLAYEFERDAINLIMIGPHKNYYRDLANYYKE